MKFRVNIYHVGNGSVWYGAWCEGEDELVKVQETLKENIASLRYMVLADDVLVPGDFIRNHCIIMYEKKES